MRKKINFHKIDKYSENSEIIKAACGGSMRSILNLCEKTDKSIINDHVGLNGCTALMASTSYGHIHCVKMLLHEGAKIDSVDNEGRTALFYAIAHNKQDIFELLLQRGSNVMHLDNEGRNILHFAAYFHRTALAEKIMLQKTSKTLYFQKDHQGNYPFHFAITQKSEEIVQLLLAAYPTEKQRLINSQDIEGDSALHHFSQYANSDEDKDWVEFLLDEGADLYQPNSKTGNSPFHLSIMFEQLDIIRSFISNIAYEEEGETEKELLTRFRIELTKLLFHHNHEGYCAFHFACILDNNQKIFDCLLACFSLAVKGKNHMKDDSDLKPHEFIDCNIETCVDRRGRSLIHMTSFMSQLSYTQTLSVHFPELIHSRDDKDRNSLYYAIVNFRQILQNHRSSVLHFQSLSKYLSSDTVNLSLIEYLVKDINIDLSNIDAFGRTCLHYASYYGQTDTIRLLLNNPPNGLSLCDIKDHRGFTPLHLSSLQGHSESSRLLILMGASVNQLDQTNSTPLHLAVRNGHWQTAESLLQLGADCTIQDQSGKTPLHYACLYHLKNQKLLKNTEGAISILLNYCSKKSIFLKDHKGLHAFHLIVSLGDLTLLNALLKITKKIHSNLMNEEITDKNGWSPLHYAAYKGHATCIQTLLEYFPQWIDIKDKRGMTALHIASSYKESSLCVRLLLMGSKQTQMVITECDNYKRTPLHVAASVGQLSICKLILSNPHSHSSFIHLKDSFDCSPLDYAKSFNHSEIVDFFLSSSDDHPIDVPPPSPLSIPLLKSIHSSLPIFNNNNNNHTPSRSINLTNTTINTDNNYKITEINVNNNDQENNKNDDNLIQNNSNNYNDITIPVKTKSKPAPSTPITSTKRSLLTTRTPLRAKLIPSITPSSSAPSSSLPSSQSISTSTSTRIATPLRPHSTNQLTPRNPITSRSKNLLQSRSLAKDVKKNKILEDLSNEERRLSLTSSEAISKKNNESKDVKKETKKDVKKDAKKEVKKMPVKDVKKRELVTKEVKKKVPSQENAPSLRVRPDVKKETKLLPKSTTGLARTTSFNAPSNSVKVSSSLTKAVSMNAKYQTNENSENSENSMATYHSVKKEAKTSSNVFDRLTLDAQKRQSRKRENLAQKTPVSNFKF